MRIIKGIEVFINRLSELLDFDRVLPAFTSADEKNINIACDKLMDNRDLKEIPVTLECGEIIYVSLC